MHKIIFRKIAIQYSTETGSYYKTRGYLLTYITIVIEVSDKHGCGLDEVLGNFLRKNIGFDNQ